MIHQKNLYIKRKEYLFNICVPVLHLPPLPPLPCHRNPETGDVHDIDVTLGCETVPFLSTPLWLCWHATVPSASRPFHLHPPQHASRDSSASFLQILGPSRGLEGFLGAKMHRGLHQSVSQPLGVQNARKTAPVENSCITPHQVTPVLTGRPQDGTVQTSLFRSQSPAKPHYICLHQNGPSLRGTLHLSLKAHDYCNLKNHPQLENAGTVPLHFTLELEVLRNQGSLNGWQTCMESYMACNGYRFMVYRILS